MKTKIIVLLIALVLPIKAQQQNTTNQKSTENNNTVGGAVAGAIVGGIVGNQLHHNSVAGVIVGGLTGALIGNAIDQSAKPPAPPAALLPPAPVMQAPVPYTPTIVYSNVNYVWGPIDRYGHPEYVYVQIWNGFEWETSYYNYFQFQTWYRHHYRQPYYEEEFHHYWQRR